MSYKDECLQRFSELPDYIRMAVGSDTAVKFLYTLEDKYKVDLQFLVILLTIGELNPENIEAYLIKKYKLKKEEAKAVQEELMTKLLFGIINDTPDSEDGSYVFDFDKNEEEIMEIFRTSLSPILRTDLNKKQNLDFSKRVLAVLVFEDKQKQLLNALYENKEIITDKEFIRDDKALKPTVENWLKDFFKKKGSSMFNNVALSDYIINSENTKKLDSRERTTLRNLLALYRNVKFFPESMGDTPDYEWEIIPSEKSYEALDKARRVSGPPLTEEEKSIEELKSAEEEYEEGGIERLALEEEIDKKAQIEGLEIEAKKYKEGSLEYKALMEEIEKLKRN